MQECYPVPPCGDVRSQRSDGNHNKEKKNGRKEVIDVQNTKRSKVLETHVPKREPYPAIGLDTLAQNP